jgi:acetyltransferase-like isoleucine patch superfamily enzyme
VQGSKIIIEDGVWIGANTTILTNSHICEGVVVSSGALVNSYIPPYCIAYGVPAKKIKRRFNNDQLQTVLKNVNSKYSSSKIIEIYEKYNIVDIY